MPGTITLRPLTANLTRDTEIFGTMDPYCKIHLGKQKVQGSVCRNGGKHPQWDETLILKRSNERLAILELKEKDWLLPDGVIGTCDINLKEVEDKHRLLKWYNLTYTGKPVGQILLELNYEDDNKINPAVQPANQFTTGTKVENVNQNLPTGWTEAKTDEKLPTGWTKIDNQNNVQPEVRPLGPGVIHGYQPSLNNNNNYQYPQDNFYNQNNRQDMFAPPVEAIHDPNSNVKYPAFESNYYPQAYNQPYNNVQEVVDYRTQQPGFQNQQTGFNPQQNYPGVTQEVLTPTHQHTKDDDNAGWDPVKIIRGVMGRK